MRTQENADESFGYRSNTETEVAERVSGKDEEDFSTLKQVVSILSDALDECGSITVIDIESKVPVAQQVLAFQAAATTIQTALLAVKDAIGEVRMKQRGIK